MQCAYLRAGADEEYLVVGMEDGSLSLINYGEERKHSPIFQVSDPHAGFQESHFEHEDAIVSLDLVQESRLDAKEPSLLLSASRDGAVNLWRVYDDKDEDYVLSFLSEIEVGEPVTSAKFIGKKRVVISSSYGNVWTSKLCKDSQDIYYLEKPMTVFHIEDHTAIMDMAILRADF